MAVWSQLITRSNGMSSIVHWTSASIWAFISSKSSKVTFDFVVLAFRFTIPVLVTRWFAQAFKERLPSLHWCPVVCCGASLQCLWQQLEQLPNWPHILLHEVSIGIYAWTCWSSSSPRIIGPPLFLLGSCFVVVLSNLAWPRVAKFLQPSLVASYLSKCGQCFPKVSPQAFLS